SECGHFATSSAQDTSEPNSAQNTAVHVTNQRDILVQSADTLPLLAQDTSEPSAQDTSEPQLLDTMFTCDSNNN
ncbi:hypothetical protein J6590_089218, partial [Homalodisca vitripennis]